MIRFPTDTQRIAIIGATGSGKTQAAIWHLSNRNFHQMPWVIYNWKGDESIDSIPGAYDLPLGEKPDRPGVYITRPLPHEDEEVENQMWAIWKDGNTGIFVDEGYMVSRSNRAFQAMLTQGRSKRIPMIVLSQRPAWMNRFVFTESEYYQIFRLQHSADIKNVEQFVPANLERRLPEYHSYYYDVGQNSLHKLSPVPDIKVIHAVFERRLVKIKKVV
jgi:hypothetical protein